MLKTARISVFINGTVRPNNYPQNETASINRALNLLPMVEDNFPVALDFDVRTQYLAIMTNTPKKMGVPAPLARFKDFTTGCTLQQFHSYLVLPKRGIHTLIAGESVDPERYPGVYSTDWSKARFSPALVLGTLVYAFGLFEGVYYTQTLYDLNKLTDEVDRFLTPNHIACFTLVEV